MSWQALEGLKRLKMALGRTGGGPTRLLAWDGVFLPFLKRPFLSSEGPFFKEGVLLPHSRPSPRCSPIPPSRFDREAGTVRECGKVEVIGFENASEIRLCSSLFPLIVGASTVRKPAPCEKHYYRIFIAFGSFPSVRSQLTCAFHGTNFRKFRVSGNCFADSFQASSFIYLSTNWFGKQIGDVFWPFDIPCENVGNGYMAYIF